MVSLLALVAHLGRPPAPPPDPFRSLRLQQTLSRLEREVADLRGESGRFARAHHLYAALGAYGEALDEACALVGAGQPPTTTVLSPGSPEAASRRMIAEIELRRRGWDW